MKVKKNFLNSLVKSCEKYSIWIDYLRVKIDEELSQEFINYFEDIFSKIDSDNSNFYLDNNLNITWTRVNLSWWPWLICHVSYYSASIPLFMMNEFHESNKIKFQWYWRFDFYGSYFRLKEIDYLDSDIINFFEWMFQNQMITRLDYRYDFFNTNKPLFSLDQIIIPQANTQCDLHWPRDTPTSWRCGSKTSKRWLVRWYDKKLDTESKGKWLLYWDYQKFDTVQRLEFEFLNKFCYWYLLKDVWVLLVDIENFIWWQQNYTKKYQSYEKLDLSNDLDRIKYVKRTNWYTKTCMLNKINMFELIENQYFELWFKKEEIKKLQKTLLINKL